MLADFLTSNRDELIARTRARVAARSSPPPTEVELTDGIPLFLDQLGSALRLATVAGAQGHEELRASARGHGQDLLHMGLTVAQVVRDYGDICQAITLLAVERKAPIAATDFQMLNLCLDEAVAEAVTEYSRQRDHRKALEGSERLGVLAHEMRNLLSTAMMSFDGIKTGQIPVGGSTAGLLARSLMSLRDLVDRSIADVRLDAGLEYREQVSVAEFLEEIEIVALLHGQARGVGFRTTHVDSTVTIEGDRQTLAATIVNLLQNAFKFTHKGGTVSLTTLATASRVVFEVHDECGGLPAGAVDALFRPFEQRGLDRSGIGLGLSICLKAAKANGGELRVTDVPGKGCIFTLDMPRTVHSRHRRRR